MRELSSKAKRISWHFNSCIDNVIFFKRWGKGSCFSSAAYGGLGREGDNEMKPRWACRNQLPRCQLVEPHNCCRKQRHHGDC